MEAAGSALAVIQLLGSVKAHRVHAVECAFHCLHASECAFHHVHTTECEFHRVYTSECAVHCVRVSETSCGSWPFGHGSRIWSLHLPQPSPLKHQPNVWTPPLRSPALTRSAQSPWPILRVPFLLLPFWVPSRKPKTSQWLSFGKQSHREKGLQISSFSFGQP